MSICHICNAIGKIGNTTPITFEAYYYSICVSLLSVNLRVVMHFHAYDCCCKFYENIKKYVLSDTLSMTEIKSVSSKFLL